MEFTSYSIFSLLAGVKASALDYTSMCMKGHQKDKKVKQFNQTISVEVSVDSIANNLLSNMKDDFKHRELVVEAVIGSALEKGGLGYIYNSLNGFNNEINFQVGDAVISTDKVYLGTKDETGKVERNYQEIGPCSVKEINIYADRKLLVEYSTYNRSGEVVTEQQWVYHTNCEKSAWRTLNNRG